MLRTASPEDFNPSLRHALRKPRSSATLLKPHSLRPQRTSSRFPPRPRSVPPRSSSYKHTRRIEEVEHLTYRAEDHEQIVENRRLTHHDALHNPFLPDPPRYSRNIAAPHRPITPDPDPFPFPLRPIASPFVRGGQNFGKLRPRAVSYGGTLPTPPRTPDRFIPVRAFPSSANYRITKPASQLSPPEKLLRDGAVSHDPFRLRRHLPPPPRRRNNNNIPPIPSPPPTLDRLGLPRRWTTGGETNRPPSNGAVWNVGGPAPPSPGPTPGIDNGRGGLLSSGSNAPMFSSDFFVPETPDQSLERFEGRLAAAFDIDRTSKVLSFGSSDARPRSVSAGSRFAQASQSTVWKDGVWFNEKRGTCKCPFLRAFG